MTGKQCGSESTGAGTGAPQKKRGNASPPVEHQFKPGNPGRPKGSRNKVTLAIQALLDGEGEAITRKAIEMALEGDVTALRLCLERLHPPRKDAPVMLSMPRMEGAESAAKAMGAILESVAKGHLTPLEARSLSGLVEGYRKALETTELEARLRALEERQA
ncbi:DUF5681 domain-containing protein [Hyphomonas sp.]|uniref:DUF5681 domain-containing protein n=1 Tax=Hyphomonas sp. TaxID=87 RepID=UPI000C5BD940|nr:DUF5681 domain-containing protein [Hyphomonas sp.]MAU68431.1 hypothetical protein [Hyphomonas sp.]MBM58387.1 hypothetical protein [Hyphomonas sp.]